MTLQLLEASTSNEVPPRQDALEAGVSRKWKLSFLTSAIAVLAVGGLGAGLYPMTASWLSSYNQSKILISHQGDLESVDPSLEEQLLQAHRYNDALSSGVVLEKNGNVPVSSGSSSDTSLVYNDILSANDEGLMARVKIPGIDVDLPIYHGTSEEVLLRGAGHLDGTHFPVGGESTRSVITAHRGLANSTMFTNLDRVNIGDTFTVETFGEVLTYQVRDTQVIDPDATDTLRAEPGQDLVTLITCTPLGINTHRILVTGERITPTPVTDIRAAGQAPTIPGFPWWGLMGAAGFLIIAGYVTRQGFIDARISTRLTQERALDTNVQPLTTGEETHKRFGGQNEKAK